MCKKMAVNWYMKNIEVHRKFFNSVNSFAEQELARMSSENFAKIVCQKAPEIFEQVLSVLPDIGGDENMASKNLLGVPLLVPYYQLARGEGLSAEDIGLIVYNALDIMTADIPQETTSKASEEFFRPERYEIIKEWAEWTDKREYPDNYVAVAVAGYEDEFDFGYNYTECAIMKVLKKMGYPELAPYACFQDYPLSRLDGRGLKRTKTLAWGDEVCDFRFKKGHISVQSWKSEINTVRERIKRGVIKEG